MTRTRSCRNCSAEFTYPVGQGNDRAHCSDSCRRAWKVRLRSLRPMCVTAGCENRKDYKSGVCNSCYIRIKRTGSSDRKVFTRRGRTSHGYVWVSSRPDHPLATGDLLYEHRLVLYDAIGPGPHPCYWCGIAVDWVKGACTKGALVPDHLDGVKWNNAISNLVPACNACNATRGLFMGWVRRHQDDPWLWRMYTASLKRDTA